MDKDERMLLGEMNGKLDALINLVEAHVRNDDERFGQVFVRLESHAADINQAKGAKSAVFVAAAVVAGIVGFAVDAFAKLFK